MEKTERTKFVKTDMIIFFDKNNEEDSYCMDEKTRDEKNELLNQYGGWGNEDTVPDGNTIMVYPIRFDSKLDEHTDLYLPSKIPVNFEINRIQWKMIKTEWK
jgi:hypothetical protein